jgi:hypothetical protein
MLPFENKKNSLIHLLVFKKELEGLLCFVRELCIVYVEK